MTGSHPGSASRLMAARTIRTHKSDGALRTDGDPPMTKLSDTQLVILGAAAQRADLSVLPLPNSLKLKGGALNKVMDSLRNRGLIRLLNTDGGPERVVITSEGMAAIGIEQEDDEAPAGAT